MLAQRGVVVARDRDRLRIVVTAGHVMLLEPGSALCGCQVLAADDVRRNAR
jgi:hypothetical protein